MIRARTRTRFGGLKWFNSSSIKADGISPTLALDFKNNRYASNGAARPLANIMTFTRGSTATYVGSDGLLKTAAINEQRLAYDPETLAFKGAMAETTAQNKAIYNRDTSGAGWGRTDITVNPTYGTAPDGTTTSNLVTEGTAGTAFLNQSISITSGSTNTHSVFLKYNNSPWVRLFFYDQSNSVNQVRVWVNLQTGVLGTVQASAPATNAAARITAYPNGFYRVSISGILSTATAVFVAIASATADAVTTRQNNAAYEVWGFQFEQSTFMSSFIPTSGSAVSRSADFFNTAVASYLTRASTATYRSYDGTLTTALDDEPRYQYAAPFPSINATRLFEESSTNNCSNNTYNVSQMTWTGSTTTGPDNVANSAGTATTDAATNNHFMSNQRTPTVIIGENYCVSAFVKHASGSQYVQLATTASAADLNFYVNYDMTTGVQTYAGSAVVASGIEVYRDNWYRIWAAFEANATGGGTACVVASIPASLSGRLASFTGTNSFYVYGMQHELGSAPTSYIPTVAAAVTRAADVVPNSSSNLLLYTSAMTNSAWTKTGCSVTDAQVDPYGTSLACLITDTAVNTYMYQSASVTGHANKTYTFSVWLKSGTKTGNISIYFKDGAGGSTIAASNATVTSSWKKFSVTGTVGPSPSASTIACFIDHVDNATAGDYYVYGAQLEIGSSASPTIVTTSANAPNAGSYNFFSQKSGTMLIDFEYESGSGAAYPMMMRFDDFTSSNRINIYYNMGGIVVGSDAQTSGSSQYGYAAAKSATFIDTARSVLAWRTDSARAAEEGTLLGSDDTSGTVPNTTRLLVADGPGIVTAYIKEALYYPHRVSNTELQRIST